MALRLIQFIGDDHTLQVMSVRLLGLNAANGRKLVITIIFFAVLYAIARTLRWLAHRFGGTRQKTAFWTRQGISLITFVLAVLGFVSIWFDNPARLATGAGLVSAGLAFALQQVITAFAGYFVILRGKTFNVGDRIKMGDVRGDVIALNFIQTVIMEMGQSPSEQEDNPGQWVESRQYSGRIVTVSNAKIFEEPVYNYTRDFPYLWEEMHVPVAFKADRARAEQIILSAVQRYTQDIANMAKPELDRLKARFFIEAADINPRVYLRFTEDYVQLAVRFLCSNHDVRSLKDRISRDILSGLDEADIAISSGDYEISTVPPLRIETARTSNARA